VPPTVNADAEDRSPNKIYPPWNDETVDALNLYQKEGEFHPFTCGQGAKGAHVGGISLVATAAGWHCPVGTCYYTQNWAWTFMAGKNSDPPPGVS